MRAADLFGEVASAIGDRTAISDRFLNALNSAMRQVAIDAEFVNQTLENTTQPGCACYELPEDVIEPVGVAYDGVPLERVNYTISPKPTTPGTPTGWSLTFQRGSKPCVFLVPTPNAAKTLLIQARVFPPPVMTMDGEVRLPLFTRQALILWTVLLVKQALNLPGWESQHLLYQREVQAINSKLGGIPRSEGGVRVRRVYCEEE